MNNEWHKYDMNLYRDFNAAKDRVLSSFEPDMFQMLKYENTIMNQPYAGGKV